MNNMEGDHPTDAEEELAALAQRLAPVHEAALDALARRDQDPVRLEHIRSEALRRRQQETAPRPEVKRNSTRRRSDSHPGTASGYSKTHRPVLNYQSRRVVWISALGAVGFLIDLIRQIIG